MANKIDELNKDLEELKTFSQQATRKRIQNYLTAETLKLQNEIQNELSTTNNKTTDNAETTSTTKPKIINENRRYVVELSQYAFDQSDKFVKLFVTLDGVQKCSDENVICEFTNNSILLTVKDLNNKDYTFAIKNLLHGINPEKSYRRIKTDMVAIYAKKTVEDTKWQTLTSIQQKLKDLQNSGMTESLKDDESGGADSNDPSAGLMKVMKKMYESGDNEMKRMLTKAWVEEEEKKRIGGDGPDMDSFGGMMGGMGGMGGK